MDDKKIITYKGFDADFKCRGYQFEAGMVYCHSGKIVVCEKGFHGCRSPFGVWVFYPPAGSRFAVVEQSGDRDGEGIKTASSCIQIHKELSLSEFVQCGVAWIIENVHDFARETNTGYQSAATNTGTQSTATNTGYQSAATNTGTQSTATNTGDYSAATNTGFRSAATNTGYQSAATNTGRQSVATNTGYQSAATNTGAQSAATNTGVQSAATNTGDYSAATNTGYQSAATVEGGDSIAVASGVSGRAKAAKGSAIVLCGYDENGDLMKIHSGIAGQDGIKPNVWYTVLDGKVEEYTP